MRRKVLLIMLVFCLTCTLSSPSILFAQDEGDPALYTVATFTMGGAVAGSLLGVMLWLIDPLNPNAVLSNSVLTGLAVGTLIGAVFGGMQLQKQAVYPYQPDLPPSSEFDGAVPVGVNRNDSPAMPTHHPEKGPILQLAKIHFSF